MVLVAQQTTSVRSFLQTWPKKALAVQDGSGTCMAGVASDEAPRVEFP